MSKTRVMCYRGRSHYLYGLFQGDQRDFFGEAIAEVTYRIEVSYRIDNKVFVCRRHLNEWLDFADDNPGWEPLEIRWLNNEPTPERRRTVY